MAESTEMRTWVRLYGPIAAFILCTGAGIVFIMVSKMAGLPVWLSITVPLLIMLGYACSHWLLKGLRLQSEQAGDNLYYMGFLYTLTSLAISLYLFATNDGGQASIDQVVNNFGIAVSSTIVGIALRIVFNQMRRDPVDIERTIRHELADMTRRVRSEMDNSALEFSSYRRTSSQMLNEGFEEIARQAEKNGEAVRAVIESMAQTATDSIEKATVRIAGSLDQIATMLAKFSENSERTLSDSSLSISKVVTSLEERAVNLADAMDATATRYQAARTPDEIFKIEVTTMTDDLRKLNSSYASTTNEHLKKMGSQVEKLDQSLVPLAAATAAAPAVVEHLARNADLTNTLSAELSQVSKAVLDSVSEQGRSREAASGVTDGLGELSRTVEALVARVAATVDVLTQTAAMSSAQHADIAAAIATMNSANSASENAAGRLTQAVTSLADKIDSLTAVGTDVDNQPRRTWWNR